MISALLGEPTCMYDHSYIEITINIYTHNSSSVDEAS